MATFLPPVERPKGLMMKVLYFFTRRQFGKVPGPLSVFMARMPLGFGAFYGKVSRLDKKLQLPASTAVLIREQVASINMCLFCMDASRYYVTRKLPDVAARLDALPEYSTSPLFSESERAALDYVSELTTHKEVKPETFERLPLYYSERQICDIVWVVASEHLYNLNNIALNIGSDGMCEIPSKPAGSARQESPAATL